jgi:hypothetical protein
MLPRPVSDLHLFMDGSLWMSNMHLNCKAPQTELKVFFFKPQPPLCMVLLISVNDNTIHPVGHIKHFKIMLESSFSNNS